MRPFQEPPEDRSSNPDSDDEARRDALAHIGRRAAIWLVPLAALAVLLVGLGLPWWGVVPVVAIAYAVVVFELDL